MRCSESEFAQVLGLSGQSIDKTLHIADLRLDQLTRLADTLNCTVETFAKGFFDLEVVRSRFGADAQSVLPSRYQKAAFSKARTSISLFQFIELNLGKAYSARILKALQVDPTHLEDYDNMISMQLVIDVANLMSQWGAHPLLLQQMGSFSAYTNRNGPVGKAFQECRNPLEVYDKMIPMLEKFYEHNHAYEILTLNHQEVIFKAKTSEYIKDSLHVHQFGSLATCEVRKGVAGSFGIYVGLEPQAVLHPKCMHRGDDCCVYHVIFGTKPIGIA